MGNLIDTEPTYNQGWGFCGDLPRYKNCNGYIDRYAKDPSGNFNHRRRIKKIGEDGEQTFNFPEPEVLFPQVPFSLFLVMKIVEPE